ncbi:hypothetical protein [Escherichia coli]|uniref:Uncharacterized protein n=1 Tax=Escherichia coli TaxID=562 RepID=A0A8T6BB27_ECOLX|nr:hypothetical protein [Escherichia coli]MVW29552.1 hypothetical protein [Escherichia coli]MXG68692.1 hypothetical protein [Escherichia coli]MXH85070.1 hypothetical protein [Escherichia coli]MXH89630.1 hypothetical protein [Escherichia coli]MXI03698.1 hypothetical protein [Escherichia coli]
MFAPKTSALDNDQEILANMLGLHYANFEIQYHAPSANAQPLNQWFKNHYEKVALHAMNQAIHRKCVRIKSLNIAFQNVISRCIPHTGSASRSRRSTTKSSKNSLSSGSSDGSDPEPASVFSSLFPSCFCHLNFPFNSFANNSFTEVAA